MYRQALVGRGVRCAAFRDMVYQRNEREMERERARERERERKSFGRWCQMRRLEPRVRCSETCLHCVKVAVGVEERREEREKKRD